MSRCAFPLLAVTLKVPSPDVIIPKLPVTPKRPNVLRNVPGIPDLIPKLKTPSPDVIIPKLPVTPKRPNIPLSLGLLSRGLSKIPGIPDLIPKLKVPSPDVIIPKLPKTPTQKCPLDLIPA